MKRRDFLKIGGAALAQANAARLLGQASQMQMGAPAPDGAKADYTLRIAPVTVELSPDHILSTTGYNDTSPGPVLRMREGEWSQDQQAAITDIIDEAAKKIERL